MFLQVPDLDDLELDEDDAILPDDPSVYADENVLAEEGLVDCAFVQNSPFSSGRCCKFWFWIRKDKIVQHKYHLRQVLHG